MRILLVLMVVLTAVWGGTVKGKVVVKGTPPKSEKVKVNMDVVVCGEEAVVRKVEVGKGGGLKDAVVWVEGAKGSLPSNRDVRITIKGCQVHPRVSVGFVGGQFIIRNEDPILHTVQLKIGLEYKKWKNTRPLETGATIYNLALPRKGMELRRPIKRFHRYQEKTGYIYVRSNAHPWMRGYIFIFDHPFAAVTDGEGRFTIEGVPEGRYKLKVWHEAFGIKELDLEVKGDEVVDITVDLGP
jgi:hypothetical protein